MKLIALCLMLTLLSCSSIANAQEKNLQSVSGMWNVISNTLGYTNENVLEADPDILDELDTYIKLFMQAAKISPGIQNATDCVDTTRDLAKSFRDSITNALNKGITEDSYLQITKSFGAAQPMLKVCFNSSYDGYKAVAKYIKDFGTADIFIEKLGLHVEYSFFAWYQLYYQFEGAINAKNNTQLTILAGKLAYTLFDFDSSLNGTFGLNSNKRQVLTTELKASFLQNVFDFAFHFLKGANVLQSDKIEFCQNNATDFKNSIDYTIDEFNKNTEEGLYNGFYALADLFGNFYNLNAVCISGYDAAWAAIIDYTKVWNVPIEIITNIVWGYRKVYKHMTAAIECGFNKDAQCSGLNSGKLIYYIFSHNPK